MALLGGSWAFTGAHWAWNGHNDGVHFWHNLLYTSLYRTVFAAALGWWILSAHSGRLSLLNRALSLRPWLVLGNLSYATYLSHPIILSLVWLRGLGGWPFVWTGFPLLCLSLCSL